VAVTIAAQRAAAVAQLRAAGSDSPQLDAELLLCHLLQRDRSYLYGWPEQPLTPLQQQQFAALLARRRAGEPIAYLTGSRHFWSLALAVSPATLIPRPESELLVELALQQLPADPAQRLLDLGTGSGAIALAVAQERPHWHITAVEQEVAALAIAEQNRHACGAEQVELLAGSWLTPVAGRAFDLVVSNPPYLRADDPHLGQGDVRFEPRSALVAGSDGLDAIRAIITGVTTQLVGRTRLLLEHGWDQAAAVRQLLQAAGGDAITSWQDGAGHQRVTGGWLPSRHHH